MNAFIGPKVRDYVSRLEDALIEAGFQADLHVMSSNGGIATAKMVSERPVLTLPSGPAAGVLGGAWSGARAWYSRSYWAALPGAAVGLRTTDLKYDVIKTEFMTSGSIDGERLNADFAAMQAQLAAQYRADGIAETDVTFARAGDLHYVGQGYELRVPFLNGTLDNVAIEGVCAAFQHLHQVEYGHVFAHSPIEIVNIRLTGIGVMPKIAPPQVTASGTLDDAPVKTAPCTFRVHGRRARVETPLYQRERLALGVTFAGRAVVIQKDATTVTPPGTRLVTDAGDDHRCGRHGGGPGTQ